MLENLYIHNLAVIDRLEIDWHHGMTVLTGETGAGKSILVDALTLAVGGRADNSLIREGEDQAEVIASFQTPANSPAHDWLLQQELIDEQSCTLRRIITRQRGSKAYINGRPVPLQFMKELGAQLVDIHGQHEHHSLLNTSVQRQLLDRFGDLESQVITLSDYYQRWHTLQQRLQSLRDGGALRESQLEFMNFQITELEDLGLQTGEHIELGEQQQRLAHTQELLQGLHSVLELLYDDDHHSAHQMISKGLEQLQKLQAYEPRLDTALQSLAEALILTDDATESLRLLANQLEADPQQLQTVEDRLGIIHTLARKHRVKGDELPALLEQFRRQRQQLLAEVMDLDSLVEQVDAAKQQYVALAAQISIQRRRVAQTLSAQVTSLMRQLGMTAGQLCIDVTEITTATRHGQDRIEFLVSTNPGQSLKSLKSTASGGELSRISLAIQVTCTHKASAPTIIFDEVDVGIGGGVAETVGRLLRRLASHCQVLCVTHLGQVAAQGDRQLAVAKKSGQSSLVTVTPLSNEHRIEEIARMLGGHQITAKTRAHAEEMLALAAACSE